MSAATVVRDSPCGRRPTEIGPKAALDPSGAVFVDPAPVAAVGLISAAPPDPSALRVPRVPAGSGLSEVAADAPTGPALAVAG
jgi:hypothetical protein